MKNILNIPKVFHFIWIGKAPKPENFNDNINKIKKLYPSFEIKIWTDKDFDFNESVYLKTAYEAEKYAFAIAYLKVKILHEHGGIYLDHDMIVLDKFKNEILRNRTLIGFDYSQLIGTGMIASVPETEILFLILNYFKMYDALEPKDIIFRQDNIIWTSTLLTQYDLKLTNQQQELRQGIEIFDFRAFNSITIKKAQYFYHQHQFSWTKYKFARWIYTCDLWAVQNIRYILVPFTSSITRSYIRDLKVQMKQLNEQN